MEEQETSEKPAEKIEHFLEVIGKTHGHHEDPRVLERIKNLYHKEYVIKPENVLQGYFYLQGEIGIREGRRADMEQSGVKIETVKKNNENGEEVEVRNFSFPEEIKKREIATVVGNQKKSLDKWIDYLTSPDADYPMWAKYFAFRSIVEMGKLVKTESEDGRIKANFQKRTKNTVASFPPLNPRALALTFDVLAKQVEEKDKPKKERQPLENKSKKLSDSEFTALLSTESFAKIYSQFLIEMPEYATEGLQEIHGEWKRYEQGSDPTPLVNSFEGYPLEWCTAAYDTAKTQLEGGDFHVFYSLNESGEAKVPRLAIRMEGSKIAEPPRGIAPNQNLDPYIAPVLEQKLSEFGAEGEAFKKRTENMQWLTEIDEKMKRGDALTKGDIIFLYEINTLIEGFGYQRDPRIAELVKQRTVEEDMSIVFNCAPKQVVRTPDAINENTKVYLGRGKLEPGIFQKLPETVEHVYATFPEKKIRRGEHIKIGGKTVQELEATLKQYGIKIPKEAEYILQSKKFVTSKESEDATLIRLTVADLGFETYATLDQIYQRAQELGLELCTAETGPHYLLQYKNQPIDKEWIWMGMEPIDDHNGFPRVFLVGRRDDGTWLHGGWSPPDNKLDSRTEFVFRLRKSSSKATEVQIK
ncbi:MAG TPA: hypothetical protein VJA22_00200 [Patescibacteria group bacterium]|nr:hypothetical protein [Patescibacteria group bacterium]